MSLPTNILRALHRPEALRKPNDHTPRPKIPHTEPSKPTRRERPLDRTDAGAPQGARLPHVCFVLRRVKLLDVDAKWGSVKDLLDGIVIAKLVDGDREDQITLEVRQETVAHYADEETIIEVTTP